MGGITDPGLILLAEVTRRLALVTPEQFRAPDMPRRSRVRALGEATPYQKALLTLRDSIDAEHVALHLRSKLPFGGHIKLPPEHEFLHAAPFILDLMLSINIANTFKELSGDIEYYISPDWRVCVVGATMSPSVPKVFKKYRLFR